MMDLWHAFGMTAFAVHLAFFLALVYETPWSHWPDVLDEWKWWQIGLGVIGSFMMAPYFYFDDHEDGVKW